MKMFKQFAHQLQARAARMKKETLVAIYIVFAALGSGACVLVIYRAIEHPPPLHRMLPMAHDSLLLSPSK